MSEGIKKGALHGECLIVQSEIPSGAKKINPKGYLKIADSETTGNHHVVDCSEGVEFYELDGFRYMKNDKTANVRCVHKDRHDTIEIPEGTWMFDSQLEYDYYTESLQRVRD